MRSTGREAFASAISAICFSAPARAVFAARAEARSRRGDGRRLIFYPSAGEALSPAICLPALGIVIPKYGLVHIFLVTATSPPQHSRKKKEGKRRRSLSPSPPLPFPPIPAFVPLWLFLYCFLSSPSRGSDAQWGKKKGPLFLSCPVLYLLNKTLALF